MNDTLYTGIRIGHYVYGHPYKTLKGRQVDFRVELTVKDGILSGSSSEEVTEKYMGSPAIISGFIEERMISMIKLYPFRYFTNGQGEIVIDRHLGNAEGRLKGFL